jgi:hypothetical protein
MDNPGTSPTFDQEALLSGRYEFECLAEVIETR